MSCWLRFLPLAFNRLEPTTVEQLRALVTRRRETDSDGRMGYRYTQSAKPRWPRLQGKRKAS